MCVLMVLALQMVSRRARRHGYNDCQALAWMQQVAAGLVYLHGSNPQIIYRDLKLENIVLKSVSLRMLKPAYDAKDILSEMQAVSVVLVASIAQVASRRTFYVFLLCAGVQNACCRQGLLQFRRAQILCSPPACHDMLQMWCAEMNDGSLHARLVDFGLSATVRQQDQAAKDAQTLCAAVTCISSHGHDIQSTRAHRAYACRSASAGVQLVCSQHAQAI